MSDARSDPQRLTGADEARTPEERWLRRAFSEAAVLTAASARAAPARASRRTRRFAQPRRIQLVLAVAVLMLAGATFAAFQRFVRPRLAGAAASTAPGARRTGARDTRAPRCRSSVARRPTPSVAPDQPAAAEAKTVERPQQARRARSRPRSRRRPGGAARAPMSAALLVPRPRWPSTTRALRCARRQARRAEPVGGARADARHLAPARRPTTGRRARRSGRPKIVGFRAASSSKGCAHRTSRRCSTWGAIARRSRGSTTARRTCSRAPLRPRAASCARAPAVARRRSAISARSPTSARRRPVLAGRAIYAPRPRATRSLRRRSRRRAPISRATRRASPTGASTPAPRRFCAPRRPESRGARPHHSCAPTHRRMLDRISTAAP